MSHDNIDADIPYWLCDNDHCGDHAELELEPNTRSN